jgi:hypothetical protein
VVSGGFDIVDVHRGNRPVCKKCICDRKNEILQCMACTTLYQDHAYDDCAVYCPKWLSSALRGSIYDAVLIRRTFVSLEIKPADTYITLLYHPSEPWHNSTSTS